MAKHERAPRRDASSPTGWRVKNMRHVHREDEITWIAPSSGSDKTGITITFPPGGNPLEPEGSASAKPGEKITKKVKKGAADGRYPYTLFCHEDRKEAEGDKSPPELIIEP